MAFTIEDVRDLVHLLAEHPEWRAELRPLILGDEMLELPANQRAIDARLDRLTAAVEALAQAQTRTEAQLGALAVRVSQLTDRVDTLVVKLDRLGDTIIGLRDQMNEDTGALYEVRFERKAQSLFGKWLRKPQVITLNDLPKVDEAEMSGALTDAEAEALWALDLLVRGGDKRAAGSPETILAIEVSRTLDTDDLERAMARAAILERLGYRARAAVGGKIAPERVRELAAEHGIIVRLVDQVS